MFRVDFLSPSTQLDGKAMAAIPRSGSTGIHQEYPWIHRLDLLLKPMGKNSANPIVVPRILGWTISIQVLFDHINHMNQCCFFRNVSVSPVFSATEKNQPSSHISHMFPASWSHPKSQSLVQKLLPHGHKPMIYPGGFQVGALEDAQAACVFDAE